MILISGLIFFIWSSSKGEKKWSFSHDAGDNNSININFDDDDDDDDEDDNADLLQKNLTKEEERDCSDETVTQFCVIVTFFRNNIFSWTS